MAKWKVTLTYKDVVEVEVEAADKEAAIQRAVLIQDFDGTHVDYFWYDSRAEQA